MPQDYDVAIVGTGVAATTIAFAVRQDGRSVVVIDEAPFGGTCALRGCDPKKVLVSAARAVDAAHRLSGKGIGDQARIDWPALMRFKHSFTDPVPAQREAQFAQQGIDGLHGTARFVGRNELDVNGTRITGRHIVLAMGARPVPLPFPGAELAITSDDFLNLPQMPRRLLTIGGGYIAVEFACIAATAGAAVTILQGPDRLLTRFDPDLVGWLTEGFRERGIDVRTGALVNGIERRGDSFLVHIEGGASIEADCVLQAAGRKPDYDTLNVNAGGVARDAHGKLLLNEFLQSTSNEFVYAAGDAAGIGPELTPVAGLDGEVVAENLLHGNRRRPIYAGIPSVAFTLPPIATVGLSEQEATSRQLRFRRNCGRAESWLTARRQGETVYGYKVLVEEGTDRILGANIVGPEADETINLFAMAIRCGVTAETMRSAVFTYPTSSSDIKYML